MFLTLEFEMKKKGYDPKDLAVLLRRSRRAVTNRLSGKVDFSRGEMLLIRNSWFPNETLDYLFAEEQKTK